MIFWGARLLHQTYLSSACLPDACSRHRSNKCKLEDVYTIDLKQRTLSSKHDYCLNAGQRLRSTEESQATHPTTTKTPFPLYGKDFTSPPKSSNIGDLSVDIPCHRTAPSVYRASFIYLYLGIHLYLIINTFLRYFAIFSFFMGKYLN